MEPTPLLSCLTGTPCTNPYTMCDFCRRDSNQPQAETVAPELDNCRHPATMCDPCRDAFNKVKTSVAERDLLTIPDTYPVVFTARWHKEPGTNNSQAPPATGVEPTRECMDKTADEIRDNLEKFFGLRVPVKVFVLFPPRDESLFGMSLLVDFPKYVCPDAALLQAMFGTALVRDWVVVLPKAEQCLSAFRLGWYRTTYDLGQAWRAGI